MTHFLTIRRPTAASRRGLTLIELLVVIVIIVTITAAVIPVMAPAVQSRKLREAARGMSTFIAGARARAAQVGRPVGVRIVPLPSNTVGSMALYYAESAPPYGGDTYDSTATLQVTGQSGWDYTLTATMTGGAFNSSLVEEGDLIQFNYQGFLYRITSVSSGSLELAVNTKGARLGWPTTGQSDQVPYKIYRQPRSGAGADAFQLPDGIVIDMAGSGEGATGQYSTAPVTIMFAPGGRIDSVYVGATSQDASGTIFLLVGKAENLGTSLNWNDTSADRTHLDNLWVAINGMSGQVAVAEMWPNGTTLADRRTLAASGQSMGGN